MRDFQNISIDASKVKLDHFNDPRFGKSVLVPEEPTEAMLHAYWVQTGESEVMRERTYARMRRYWKAMLSAL